MGKQHLGGKKREGEKKGQRVIFFAQENKFNQPYSGPRIKKVGEYFVDKNSTSCNGLAFCLRKSRKQAANGKMVAP